MHVVVNAAMSADGKLSSRRREQIRISGDDDFDRVDQVRAEHDAVVVGIGTVLADDPSLTVSEDRARRAGDEFVQPARVVVDSTARTPPDAAVLDDAARTFVCVSDRAPIDRRMELDDRAELVVAGDAEVDLPRAFGAIAQRGVDRFMVEGGGELIFSLFEDGLVDELRVFVGPTVIGGRDAPTLADGDGFVDEFPLLELAELRELDDGVLVTWRVSDEFRDAD
jgi:2,5-diamino-6-(ribosylamino)-4(3H)-pyrimidinone 5'-phosphate reductase